MKSAVIEKFSPDRAKKLLSASNRKIRQSVVDTYSRSMLNKDWTLSESVIFFDAEGNLVNGHHRMSAIVASGTTQEFFVARGATPQMIVNFDQGLKRSGRDALHYAGKNYPGSYVEAVRAVKNYESRTTVKMTQSEIVRCVDQYVGGLDFIHEWAKNRVRGVSSAPVIAAFVIAYYEMSHNVLREIAMQVLAGADSDGKINPAANTFRTEMISGGSSLPGDKRIKVTHRALHLISSLASNPQMKRLPPVPDITEGINFA